MRSNVLPSGNTAGCIEQPAIGPVLRRRGFLPEPDPLCAFPSNSEYAVLDEIGHDFAELVARSRLSRYAPAG